jgi:8-oxo-dGTP pyrophosphatase MutT (NUDIX family)
MAITPWKILESKYIFNDRWLKVRADRCETSEGKILDPYYVHEPLDWVHVVAFDASDRVLITRQYRHGTRTICSEIPCGGVESGEDPLVAMKRELLEETGCTAEVFQSLPPFSPNPANFSNTIYPFLALKVKQTDTQKLDEAEEIEFEFVPVPALMEMIEHGQIQQPLHVASIFLALKMRGMLKLASVEQTAGRDALSRAWQPGRYPTEL